VRIRPVSSWQSGPFIGSGIDPVFWIFKTRQKRSDTDRESNLERTGKEEIVRQKVHVSAESSAFSFPGNQIKKATIENTLGLIMLELLGYSSCKIERFQAVFFGSLYPLNTRHQGASLGGWLEHSEFHYWCQRDFRFCFCRFLFVRTDPALAT
jgi:hypothetical protein